MPDAPTHAGAYRLVSHIASGGMGIVYLAEREDGGEPTRAAVKLIRRGIDDDQARRFDAERRILASLQHPNIARLIDAGVTDDHRPYLVMEYVAGLPIDRYCDQHRLSIRHRVALLRNVARAVAHAHHNLVVHRDLKPSNIFVTHIGVVKLLDFGIAKLSGDAELDRPLTVEGIVLGTPSFIAPERVRGAAYDGRSDVYGVGAMLYRMLTGHLPFAETGGDAHALLSAKLVSDPRAMRELDPAIPAQVEAVVMRALRRDPAQRPAAAALADQLESLG